MTRFPCLRKDLALIPMPPDALQLRAGDEEVLVLRGHDPDATGALLRRLDGSAPPADLRVPGLTAEDIAALVDQLDAAGLLAAAPADDPLDRYLSHFPGTASVAGARVDVAGDGLLADLVHSLLGEHGLAVAPLRPGDAPRDGSRAIVCAWEQPHLSFVMDVNALAVRSGIPCLFADLSHGFHATLGPFYIPREGACYQCLHARLLENSASPDELAAAARLMRTTNEPLPGFGTTPAHRHLLAALAASEVLALLTAHRPLRTLNRTLTVDLEGLSIHPEPAWRIPWCPACSPRP